MRPTVNTGIGIGVIVALVLVGVLGWRTFTRPTEPPALSALSNSPSADLSPSSASPSLLAESTRPDVAEPTVATGVDARVVRIPRKQWRLIVSTGTWRPGCPSGRSDLRRMELNYRTFDGGVERGQLIANKDSVDDLLEIFSALFDAGFPIERMEPVERYGGEVNRSLEANNTSAFNCRKPGQINAPVEDSPHANGRAVDINPVQNPWRDPRCTCWQPSREFAKDKVGPGIIREGSLPVQLFEDRGWVWQNIEVPDYMHFDTGYPSRPRTEEPDPGDETS